MHSPPHRLKPRAPRPLLRAAAAPGPLGPGPAVCGEAVAPLVQALECSRWAADFAGPGPVVDSAGPAQVADCADLAQVVDSLEAVQAVDSAEAAGCADPAQVADCGEAAQLADCAAARQPARRLDLRPGSNSRPACSGTIGGRAA